MNAHKDEFAIQLIARGAFIDDGVGNGKLYVVDTHTIRLNHVALDEWHMSEMCNSRACYETYEKWLEYKAKYEARRETFKERLTTALGIDDSNGGISIIQAQSEVFTLVHIYEVGQ